jgi:hypothetical protein
MNVVDRRFPRDISDADSVFSQKIRTRRRAKRTHPARVPTAHARKRHVRRDLPTCVSLPHAAVSATARARSIARSVERPRLGVVRAIPFPAKSTKRCHSRAFHPTPPYRRATDLLLRLLRPPAHSLPSRFARRARRAFPRAPRAPRARLELGSPRTRASRVAMRARLQLGAGGGFETATFGENV